MLFPLSLNTLSQNSCSQDRKITQKQSAQLKHCGLHISRGVPLYSVNKNNISTVISQIQVDGDVKDDIINAVSSGNEVVISQYNIDFHGWVGCGYIIFDPVHGGGAYKISGGLNGAFAVLLSYFNTTLNIISLFYPDNDVNLGIYLDKYFSSEMPKIFGNVVKGFSLGVKLYYVFSTGDLDRQEKILLTTMVLSMFVLVNVLLPIIIPPPLGTLAVPLCGVAISWLVKMMLPAKYGEYVFYIIYDGKFVLFAKTKYLQIYIDYRV